MGGRVFLGIGANLPTDRFGSPRRTCGAALDDLSGHPEVEIAAVSRWWESAPVPISDQPWYVNAVVELSRAPEPADLLQILLGVEADLGRVRAEKNAARVLDLDIVDYDGRIEVGDPILPHPRLERRAFVLLPLQDLAPTWRHPTTQDPIDALCQGLPDDQDIRPMPPADGLFGTEWQSRS